MNPDPYSDLAERLRDDPSLFERVDDSLLGELIYLYRNGELNAESAAEAAALIDSDPRSAAILQSLNDAEAFADSSEGKAWLEGLPARALAMQGESFEARIGQEDSPERESADAAPGLLRFPEAGTRHVLPERAASPWSLAALSDSGGRRTTVFRLGKAGLTLRTVPLDGGSIALLLCDQTGQTFTNTDGWAVVGAGDTEYPLKNGWAQIPASLLEEGFAVQAGDGTILSPEPDAAPDNA